MLRLQCCLSLANALRLLCFLLVLVALLVLLVPEVLRVLQVLLALLTRSTGTTRTTSIANAASSSSATSTAIGGAISKTNDPIAGAVALASVSGLQRPARRTTTHHIATRGSHKMLG